MVSTMAMRPIQWCTWLNRYRRRCVCRETQAAAVRQPLELQQRLGGGGRSHCGPQAPPAVQHALQCHLGAGVLTAHAAPGGGVHPGGTTAMAHEQSGMQQLARTGLGRKSASTTCAAASPSATPPMACTSQTQSLSARTAAELGSRSMHACMAAPSGLPCRRPVPCWLLPSYNDALRTRSSEKLQARLRFCLDMARSCLPWHCSSGRTLLTLRWPNRAACLVHVVDADALKLVGRQLGAEYDAQHPADERRHAQCRMQPDPHRRVFLRRHRERPLTL
jgi:hypothetical protein